MKGRTLIAAVNKWLSYFEKEKEKE